MASAGGRRLQWPQGVSPHPVYTYTFSQWLKQTLTKVLLGRDFIDIIQVQIGVDLKIRRLSGCSQPNWVSPQKGRGSSWRERLEAWKGFDGREILHCWFEDRGNHVARKEGGPGSRKQPQLTASKEMEALVLQPQRTESCSQPARGCGPPVDNVAWPWF